MMIRARETTEGTRENDIPDARDSRGKRDAFVLEREQIVNHVRRMDCVTTPLPIERFWKEGRDA